MNFRTLLLPVFIIPILVGCHPKPIDIDIPQGAPTLSISSMSVDEHSVYVSAGYSISSLARLGDTTKGKSITYIPKEMLVDSGLVTLTSPSGKIDTLPKIADGLYGSNNLQLSANATYMLHVHDYRKGATATASTTYLTSPVIDSILPVVSRSTSDTAVRLNLIMSNVAIGDHYFVSYSTARAVREASNPNTYNLSSLGSFVPKQMALFTGDEALNGKLSKSIALTVKGNDTVMVQIARIDAAYYNYLSAYKRSGYLINQLTGEPINLPTNVVTGLGFFSIYQPQRHFFALERY